MTNLQKIQQETEEIFFNKYPVGMETIDFLHSRESIAYKAGLDEVREKVEKIMQEVEDETPTMVKNQSAYSCIICGFKPSALKEVLLTLIDDEINKAA